MSFKGDQLSSKLSAGDSIASYFGFLCLTGENILFFTSLGSLVPHFTFTEISDILFMFKIKVRLKLIFNVYKK